jgi:DNA-binding transcriptional MerR regulator/methylmalonyl-CoA mutase cobalamin-binding subunit
MGEAVTPIRPHESLPLRTVARLTGLTPDVIRAWERRYGVVAPTRGPRGARLYSDADVAQLRLLRQAVASGRAIGDVARLSAAELEGLLGGAPAAVRAVSPALAPRSAVGDGVVSAVIAALERFDAGAVDRCVGDALLALGVRDFVVRVAVPLMTEVGERWRDGRLSVADEHLVSGTMRNLLAGVLRSRGTIGQPRVLLATPSGERHELGLLLAGLMIAEAGCGLSYLSIDLPAAEIVAAARRTSAAVVGLGVTADADNDEVLAEVRRIERELPAATELWLGGRGAAALAARLTTTRAIVVDDMACLDEEVSRLCAQGARRA